MNNKNNKCYVIALTEIYLLYWFGAAGMVQWFIGDSTRPLPPQTSLGSVPWLESIWRLIYIVVNAGFISPHYQLLFVSDKQAHQAKSDSLV